MPNLLVALLIVLGAHGATDLSGRWTLTLDPDFSGERDTLNCTLKQDGADVTADCGGPAIRGRLINQNLTLQLQTGQDDKATATLTGTLDQAATTISGTWHLDPDNKDGHFEFKKR